MQPNATSSVSETLVQVGDVDKDGLPDVLDLRVADPVAVYSGRTMGQSQRPGLLVRVVEGAGAEIELDYQSSATLPEIGQEDDVYAPLRKDLVARIEVSDPVTQWTGFRLFDRAEPIQITSEEGGGVRFAGFGWTAESEWSRERYELFGLSNPPGHPPFLPVEVELGWTETFWEIDRDHQLPYSRTVYTDANASWVPGRDPYLYHEHGRQSTLFTYFTPVALPIPLGATGGWVAVPKWADVTTAHSVVPQLRPDTPRRAP